MQNIKIGVFVGSLRKESYTKKLSNTIFSMFPDSFDYEEVDLYELEMYNQDFDDEEQPAASWTRFRNQVRKYDGLLFLTPEYNRSIPAVLKNAIDIGSRPAGKNVWSQKPAGIITISPGALGGFGANHHLRQVLTCLNVPTMQQPEAYLGFAGTLFNENGVMDSKITREFLEIYLAAYEKWILKNLKSLK